MSDCTGRCCEAFTPRLNDGKGRKVSMSPAAFKRAYRLFSDWICGRRKWPKGVGIVKDIHLLFPMLIYIGRGAVDNARSGYIPEAAARKRGMRIEHVYTCKHFDAAARRCTIYEFRPDMCRVHGVTVPCYHEKCEMKCKAAS